MIFSNLQLILFALCCVGILSVILPLPRCTSVFPEHLHEGDQLFRKYFNQLNEKVQANSNITEKSEYYPQLVLVIGQVLRDNLMVEWIYPYENSSRTFRLRVGVSNLVNGRDSMSSYSTIQDIDTETGYTYIELPNTICQYDYIVFQTCTNFSNNGSGYSEDKERCDKPQIIITAATRLREEEPMILNTSVTGNEILLDVNSEVKIEENEKVILECIVSDLSSDTNRVAYSLEERVLEIEATKYRLKAHGLRFASTYLCVIQIHSPEFYRLYSKDILSFKTKRKNENENAVKKESKERIKFRRSMSAVDEAMMKKIEWLREQPWFMKRDQGTKRVSFRTVASRRISSLPESMKENMKNNIKEYKKRKDNEKLEKLMTEIVQNNRRRKCKLDALDHLMKQVLDRTQLPTVSKEQPTIKKEQPTLKKEQPTLKKEQPTMKKEQPTIKKEQPTIKKEQPTLKKEQPTIKKEQPTLKKEQPTIKKEQPTLKKEQPTIKKEQPTIKKEQPTIKKEQPTMKKEQPTIKKEQPTIKKEQPTLKKEQPTVKKEQPTIKKEQLTVEKEQPTVKKEQPTIKKEQPTLKKEQPTIKKEQPTIKKEQPTIKKEQPTIKKEQPTLKKEQPTMKKEQPTIKKEQPTIKTEQPTLKKEQPTLKKEQPTLKKEQPTLKKEQPTLKKEQPALKKEQPTLKKEQPTLKKEQPTIKKEQPTLKKEQPTVKKEQPTLKKEQPTVKKEPTVEKQQPQVEVVSCKNKGEVNRYRNFIENFKTKKHLNVIFSGNFKYGNKHIPICTI